MSTHFAFPSTNDLKYSTRLRIVLSCILWWLREDELLQTHLHQKPHRMYFFLFRAKLLDWIMPGEAEWGSAEGQPHKE